MRNRGQAQDKFFKMKPSWRNNSLRYFTNGYVWQTTSWKVFYQKKLFKSKLAILQSQKINLVFGKTAF